MLIKEMAQRLQVTPRTIRFYEEKGLLTPHKDQNNQYRIYRDVDAWRLQTILVLREVGMSLSQIKNVLAEIEKGAEEEVHYYLQLQRSILFTESLKLKGMIHTLDQIIDQYDTKNENTWQVSWQLAEESRRTHAKRHWEDRWNFDQQAPSYDQQVLKGNKEFDVHQDYERGLNLVVQWVQPQVGEIGLDLGTGTGNLAGLFLQRGMMIKGMDQSKEMLKVCHQKHPNIETRMGNFLAIPYDDQQFDFVVTSYALHHLTDEQKSLALIEMKRVCKPGGRICILDLMFADAKSRTAYLQRWERKQRDEIVAVIEDEFYADRSQLVHQLEQEGFQVKTRQINDILHILLAQSKKP
ncbi:MerR family transcriptional regulator [Hazenella coriacea]|uniref:Putative AdoMet-dependent methyltransferase n=1 Tax=Hazenella coriacea TaxID=1179467 RepID=A0A4R3LC72_9BACL|nr:MerR family transcriptional regulator [Hazenella coriacea]TCS95924.1 putative AdoMet-dependent methyltransferase [Hazenella coriacea]